MANEGFLKHVLYKAPEEYRKTWTDHKNGYEIGTRSFI
jgi:hypothetical protein